jgi:hypothetical protein
VLVLCVQLSCVFGARLQHRKRLQAPAQQLLPALILSSCVNSACRTTDGFFFSYFNHANLHRNLN